MTSNTWDQPNANGPKTGSLEDQLTFWKEDSAVAWDKCEERRLAQEKAETEAARLAVDNDMLRECIQNLLLVCRAHRINEPFVKDAADMIEASKKSA